MAGLRLELAPGWKTYWRVPGEAGIPPRFEWHGNRNVEDIAVSWPAPQVFYEYGMRSIGYKSSIVLPLTIQPKQNGREIHLEGRMRLGVCADVCVPYEIDIASTLLEADQSPTPAIAAALASRPYNARDGEVQSAVCRVTPTEDGMRVEAHINLPHTGGREVAVIEPGLPDIWTGESQTARQGRTLVAVSDLMHLDGDPFSVDRSRVRITVIGSDYSVDIRGCTGR